MHKGYASPDSTPRGFGRRTRLERKNMVARFLLPVLLLPAFLAAAPFQTPAHAAAIAGVAPGLPGDSQAVSLLRETA